VSESAISAVAEVPALTTRHVDFRESQVKNLQNVCVVCRIVNLGVRSHHVTTVLAAIECHIVANIPLIRHAVCTADQNKAERGANDAQKGRHVVTH